MKIKTIDIEAYSYWDKVNGNSYFNATLTINYGMANFIRIHIPMQYGHDYTAAARNVLNELKYIKTDQPLWYYCRDKKIILRANVIEGFKYRELTNKDKQEAKRIQELQHTS